MLSRIYKNLFFDGENFRGYRVDIAYLFYFVAEEFESNREGFIRRVQFDHIAAYPERTPLEVDVVSAVLDIG